MNSERRDTYQLITDAILKALESCGEWERPWTRSASSALPKNEITGATYRGSNIVMCWVSAQEHGFSQQRWGTFQQWKTKGAAVKKGAKGTPIIFFNKVDREATDDAGETTLRSIPFARLSWVFNIDQVEGYTPEDATVENAIEPADRADQAITATGATILHGGDRACYVPSTDNIHMPNKAAFVGTATSTATESYYGTLLHELTHWTGPRLKREFGKRFGDEAYAAEELVAELGAAFLCAQLGISPAPRTDHASYVANWLTLLRNDKRAFITAASAASAAADFILAGAQETRAAA